MIVARNISPNGSANLLSIKITDFDLKNERIICRESELEKVYEIDFFKKCKEKESRPRNVYGNG